MTITELIAKLEAIRAEHGDDVPCMVADSSLGLDDVSDVTLAAERSSIYSAWPPTVVLA